MFMWYMSDMWKEDRLDLLQKMTRVKMASIQSLMNLFDLYNEKLDLKIKKIKDNLRNSR